MVQDDGPLGLDRVQVVFDDRRTVSDAGIVLVATLARAAGDRVVGGAVCASWRARRGGQRRPQGDDADLRDGARRGQHRGLRRAALGAPVSAAGQGGRALDAGDISARIHVRACSPARPAACRNAHRAWRAGAGPGRGRLVVDVDSFVGELYGRAKQGAAFGYTRRRGYHPISRPAPRPARSCTSASERDRRTPRAESAASWTS
jgi:hypothetical protein